MDNLFSRSRLSFASIMVFILAVLLIVSSLPTAAMAQSKPSMKFCYLCRVGSICQQAMYGVPHYAKKFDAIDWSIKLVGYKGSNTIQHLTQAILTNGTDCDIFLGPGSSSYSKSISSGITKPWVDFASTATDLSNKQLYPTFSRIIPTDAVGAKGMLSIMDNYGWKSAYLLCTNEAYGQSLAAALEAGIQARGGTSKTNCVSSDSDEHTMRQVANDIRESNFRVVHVLMAGWVNSFVNILKELETWKVNNTKVFVFGESVCSGWGSLPTAIHGSFCVSYGYKFQEYTSFYDEIQSGNAVQFKQEVEDIGLAFEVLRNTSNPDYTYHGYIFDAFSIDAFIHVMNVVDTAQRAGKFDKSSTNNTIHLLRTMNTTDAPFTGSIVLDENGDRTAVLMDLASITPGGIKTFGSWTLERGFYHNTSLLSEIYVPLKGSSDLVDLPSGDDDDNDTKLVIAVVIPIVTIALLFAVLLVIMLSLTSPTRFAPKDRQKPFAMLTLDMQKSTALWDRYPDAMRDVIKAYNQIVRRVLRNYPVYEVNTQGDSFTIVAKDVDALVACAESIQLDLYRNHWPGGGALDEFYIAEVDSEAQTPGSGSPAGFGRLMGDDASVSSGSSSKNAVGGNYFSCWNGPRCRMTINFGTGIITKVSGGRLEYSGDVMDGCKELEGIANGGQVVLSQAALNAASGENQTKASAFATINTAEHNMPVYNLKVPALENRLFVSRAKKKMPVAIPVASTTPSATPNNPLGSQFGRSATPTQTPTVPMSTPAPREGELSPNTNGNGNGPTGEEKNESSLRVESIRTSQELVGSESTP